MLRHRSPRFALFVLLAMAIAGAYPVWAQTAAPTAVPIGSSQQGLVRCLSGEIKSLHCKTIVRNFWQHNREMENAAHAAGLEPALVRAMAAVESHFNASAVSEKGATGVLQLMPNTARSLGVAQTAELYHAPTNLAAGALYLRRMYAEFRDWPLALAAYNAGPGTVYKYGGQIPPYIETQNYVRSVLHLYRLFRDAEKRPMGG